VKKQASKTIGKREYAMRTPDYVHEGGAVEETSEGSGFSMIPILGRSAGSNKFARAGMAIGSLLAVTTCMFALFGSDSNQ
jgi:hypothetical protein